MRISRLEVILSIISSIGLYILLAVFALGGPLSTDILWYMNVGLNNVKDTFILNRYFHVYLEKLFMEVAPNPLIGVQHYWAFLLAVTVLLIYLNGRIFSSKSTLFHAGLAVGIFFSIQAIGETAGINLVDITAMFMVMLLVTIYLISARRKHHLIWLVVLLGFVFYLAIKTKETTLVTGILFVGLGFKENGKFNIPTFLRNILYFVIGFIVCMVMFGILNWVILGDPFFGLRLSDIHEFLNTYIRLVAVESHQETSYGNWYTIYLFQAVYIPFVLYIISGLRKSPDLHPALRLIWVIPLALIIFISLTTSINWGIRFFLPAVPVISLLVPQFLDFALPNSIREKIKIAALFLGGVMIVGLIRVAFRYFLPKAGWNISMFLVVVYEPIILSIILALTFLWKNISLKRSILIAVLIVALIASPIIANFKEIFIYRHNQRLSQEMFYPLAVFSDEIQYKPDMFMYVSQKAWAVVGMSPFAKNHDEVMDLFNIYFDASSTRDNFTYTTESLDNINDIINTDYDYILLSATEWKNVIEEDPNNQELIDRKYQTFFEPRNLIVLLQAY